MKVYCEAGKQLAKAERYTGIAQLVGCIKRSGTNDEDVTDMCDEMLTLAVATFTKAKVSGTKVEDLIKLISDRATKVGITSFFTLYFLKSVLQPLFCGLMFSFCLFVSVWFADFGLHRGETAEDGLFLGGEV